MNLLTVKVGAQDSQSIELSHHIIEFFWSSYRYKWTLPQIRDVLIQRASLFR